MNKLFRNILIFVFIALIVICGVFSYFYYTKEEKTVTQLLKAVPADASLIIECKNINTLISSLENKNNIWNLLVQIPELESINNELNWLNKTISESIELKKITSKEPLLISLNSFGKNDYESLFLINFGSTINEEKINNFLKKEFKDSITQSSRFYNNYNLYESEISAKCYINKFYWSVARGVFIYSKSSILVEDAIRQVQSSFSLLNNQSFCKVQQTAGKNVEANIYINNKTFYKILSNELSDNYKKTAKSFNNIADWSEIDFHLKPDMFMFNGFTNPGDSLQNYTNIFLRQEPQKFSSVKILPNNVYSYVFLGISNFKNYLTDYKTYLESAGKIKEYNETLNFYKNNYSIDVEKLFAAIIDNEVVMAFADNQLSNKDSLKSEYLIIKTKGISQVQTIVEQLINNVALKQNKKPENFKFNCIIDKETFFQGYYLPLSKAGGQLFGKIFERVPTSYFTFVDNYIVFSSSKAALTELHHSFLLKKTLENDAFYNNYTENLDNKSNFLFYIDMSRANDFISSFLKKQNAELFNKNFDVFSRFDGLSCQMTVLQKMIYTSVVVKYNPEIKQKTHTIWESRLDSTISQKPIFLQNDITNEREIFVQDDGKTIYLINNTGRILWKNTITEKILSEIFQIYNKNGKNRHLLFSTRNYIYLIDNNGEVVEHYPIKLKSAATNGMSVTEPDKNNKFKIYIACSDKIVYCYNIDGTLVKNWKPKPTDNYVYQPIQTLKIKDKEVIVFGDTLKIYILDNKGDDVVKVGDIIPRNKNSILYFEPKNPETDNRLVTNSVDGNIYYVYFDGKVQHKWFGDFSENNYFEFKDLDVDGYNDYIFLNNDELSVYNKLKRKFFTYEFSEKSDYKPVFYEFPGGNRNKIGVVCRNENKIYMIDLEGNLSKGFPIEGCTPFSISHFVDGKRNYNLIVGSNEGFLLNYEVY